jgi:transcriptional regulator GlxA family with amidase domain
MERFVSELRTANKNDQLTASAMEVLAGLGRSTRLEGSIEALARLIRSRVSEPILLEQLAGELQVHPTAITKQLRRKFNMTFRQYVARLRIDQAKRLLRETRLSVTEIAARVGIRGASNFGKLFRRFEGVSPTEYRAQFEGFHEAAGH